MKHSAHRQFGFTLIEGIVAMGIISSALIVGLTLGISNLTAAQANSDRIIAGQLAREAIEVARNIRDSNWLRREANIDQDSATPFVQFYEWDDIFDAWPDLAAGGDIGNYYDVQLNDFSIPWSAYPYTLVLRGDAETNKDLESCIAAGEISCRVQKQNSVYYQSDAQTGEPTQFYRRLIIKPICRDDATDAIIVEEFDPSSQDITCDDGNDERVGVLVVVRVMWERGGFFREVRVKERLYNWRSS